MQSDKELKDGMCSSFHGESGGLTFEIALINNLGNVEFYYGNDWIIQTNMSLIREGKKYFVNQFYKRDCQSNCALSQQFYGKATNITVAFLFDQVIDCSN